MAAARLSMGVLAFSLLAVPISRGVVLRQGESQTFSFSSMTPYLDAPGPPVTRELYGVNGELARIPPGAFTIRVEFLVGNSVFNSYDHNFEANSGNGGFDSGGDGIPWPDNSGAIRVTYVSGPPGSLTTDLTFLRALQGGPAGLYQAVLVPEPGTASLFVLGVTFCLSGLARWRRPYHRPKAE